MPEGAANATTVSGDGRFAGMLAPRQAVWYRFVYANPGANAVVNVGLTPAGTSADLNLYTGDIQYAPGAPMWLARPSDLPGTDLTFAFEQG